MIKVLGKRRTAEIPERVLLSKVAGGKCTEIVEKESYELRLQSPSMNNRKPYSGESNDNPTGKLLDKAKVSSHI